MPLQGKTAIVTGASQGIGAATAEHLAAQGATVIVDFESDAHQADAEAVVTKISQAGGTAFAVQADISQPAEAKALVQAAISLTDRLDIVVNNAGRYTRLPVSEIDQEHLDYHFDVNFRGALLTGQAAAKHLPAGGRIIYVTSGLSRRITAGCAAYAASKAATEALTRCQAAELGPSGITVNTVAPGIVETEQLQRNLVPEAKAELVRATALGRVGTPADIARVITFLATEDAGWISGQVIDVDGGLA